MIWNDQALNFFQSSKFYLNLKAQHRHSFINYGYYTASAKRQKLYQCKHLYTNSVMSNNCQCVSIVSQAMQLHSTCPPWKPHKFTFCAWKASGYPRLPDDLQASSAGQTYEIFASNNMLHEIELSKKTPNPQHSWVLRHKFASTVGNIKEHFLKISSAVRGPNKILLLIALCTPTAQHQIHICKEHCCLA